MLFKMNNKKTIPSKLPGIAFAHLAAKKATVAITRGEPQFYRVDTTKSADELNRLYGVTPAQARAMLCGAMLGWRSSLANPDLYGERGELLETPPPALD